jgi:hypothetical protein
MGKLKNELSWSFSRHGTLDECPRRYWFQYYGSWEGWDENAPHRTREIYRLKQVTARPIWQGTMLHAAIARAELRAKEGRPVRGGAAVSDFVGEVLQRMRADYKDSREDRARKSGRYKWHARFFEHEQGIDDGSPDWRARWKETADNVDKGLRNFFSSRVHDQLCELPEGDWIEVEDPAANVGPSFELDGLRVYARVDLAYRDAGKPTLIDWKTGRSLNAATPVQLAVYAIYLQQLHDIDPLDLRAREINVVTGESADHDIGPGALEEFREVFAESVEQMRSLLSDPAENVPKPEDEFRFAPNERSCNWCHFRSVCPRFA